MSNDYALFIITIPNDFDLETSAPATKASGNESNPESTTISGSHLSAIVPLGDTPLSSPSLIIPLNKRNSEVEFHSNQQPSTSVSICVSLKNYLAERNDPEATWILCDNDKKFQITFYAEFGLASDRTLHDLGKLGIGKRSGTKVSVLPTTIVLKGEQVERNGSVSLSLDSTQDVNTLLGNKITMINEEFQENQNNAENCQDLTLSDKIRRRILKSDFRKSVRARLMVHQVVASIRASSAISFDFVLLICLASMLAAFGLLENSTVIIVASMLVSPLMNPILGFVFGLSVRDHSLWQQSLRNEVIGLIICISCGFLLGLFTTFFETKWGSSASFPTTEMRSRGDVKRLWVGVLIALPSGAGVALSVLGGNTGSLVGVAISASLLPPAVNCGLLFAYGLYGKLFHIVAAAYSSPLHVTNGQFSFPADCPKYINNNYQPLYTCNLSTEAIILALSSLLLTIINIICIVIMALIILRIKEVVPLNQANKDIANFFHHDVKVARDYNKTIHQGELPGWDSTVAGVRRNNLAQSIVNRWKGFKSPASQSEQEQSTVSNQTDLESAIDTQHSFSNDIQSRKKLLRLQTFAKEYDLDLFNKDNYNLTSSDSQEKVRLLVRDLIDMYQEMPLVFVDLYRLQPSEAESSVTDGEHLSFYEEMVEILPPKWYQLFKYERQRRHLTPWSKPLSRSDSIQQHSLHAHQNLFTISNESQLHQSLKRKNKKHRARLVRRSSVPDWHTRPVFTAFNPEVPIAGTRFRIVKAPVAIATIAETSDDESKPT